MGNPELSDLPVGYGENVLILLMQSCSVLFAYWEVSVAAQEFLKGKDLVLRLVSVVNGFVVPGMVVSPSFYTGDWYFRGVNPGGRYRAELGWYEDGEFYPLLCSEVVDVPPEKTWRWVPIRQRGGQEADGVFFVEAVRSIGISSGSLGER